ncbi:lipoyl domain-containing protein [Mycobacterium colombiense]|uniref:Dihydrolipoamide acyltransferase n=1 Tax=Mycobacterium colombiense CECT 3035 TaxID=1041522 RepID=J4JVP9_9MYCO|nr:lipoyl domain-containing protein [Mycobacterium colombiense]EJO89417.1 dihydrolipoamide acyltransferase [Mycobacterium colombiense CECT 3035]
MPLIHRIKIPKLGMAVDAATLSEWLVADGEGVEAGTPLYVAATDKVDQEIQSPVSGTIRLIGEADTTYPVGTLIAEIVEQ